MVKPEFGYTVNNFISRKSDILLVHEIGEENGKPAKWGLSGGNCLIDPGQDRDLSEEQIIRKSFNQINTFARRQGISEDALAELWASNPPIELLFFLTAVREALEEMGVLIQPICELMRESSQPRLEAQLFEASHKVILIQSYILEGKPMCSYDEVDNIGWFHYDNLPADIYPSHQRRINFAIRKTRIDLCEKFENSEMASVE